MVNDQRSFMHMNDIILSNPHMREFEDKYFAQLQEDRSRAKFAELANEMTNARLNLKNAYPFGGYNSLDTNLYNRFTKENIENEKLHKIGNLLDEIRHLKDKNFPTVAPVNPLEVAKIKQQIKQVDKAKAQNALRLPHDTAFARPYEENKDAINKLQKRMKELSDNLDKEMTAPKPTPEEQAVLRRLNEKMTAVVNRLAALPDPGMEDHILVQAQMLSGLSTLMRRMANAVDDEHRESFLYQIHDLLHFHNLQDQPYIAEFERDLAHSIATGDKMYEVARYDALKQLNLDQAERARETAAQMKQYGSELVNKAKEMRHREEMMEREQSIPSLQKHLVHQELKNRVLA